MGDTNPAGMSCLLFLYRSRDIASFLSSSASSLIQSCKRTTYLELDISTPAFISQLIAQMDTTSPASPFILHAYELSTLANDMIYMESTNSLPTSRPSPLSRDLGSGPTSQPLPTIKEGC